MGQRLLRRFKGYGCSMIGACRVTAYADDVVVILNCPLGCAHILRDRELERNYQAANGMRGMFNSIGRKIVYTNLTNDDCIYGSAKKLAATISGVVEHYNPAYILVVNSCMVGIIGDDVAAVAAQAEAEYKVPVLTIDSFGFMNGAYSNGFRLAVNGLIKRFCSLQQKQAAQLIIIAPFEGKNSAAFCTVKKYLNFLGVEKIILFPGAAGLEEIKQLGSCRYGAVLDHNNMLVDDYKEAAEVLREELSIQILDYADPVGLQGTLSWLEQMHMVLHFPEAAYQLLRKQLQEAYRQCVNEFLAVAGRENTVSIVIRDAKVTLNFSWLEELLEDLQLKVDSIYLDQDNSLAGGNVLQTMLRQVPMLAKINCHYLTENEISMRLADKHVLSVRIPHEVLPFATPLPYMNLGFGIDGIRTLVAAIKRMILQRKHRGYYE